MEFMDKFSAIDDFILFRRIEEINEAFQDFHISAYKSDLLIKERDEIRVELQKRGYPDINER